MEKYLRLDLAQGEVGKGGLVTTTLCHDYDHQHFSTCSSAKKGPLAGASWKERTLGGILYKTLTGLPLESSTLQRYSWKVLWICSY
eukprot:5138748-Amphidinium_carterae.1